MLGLNGLSLWGLLVAYGNIADANLLCENTDNLVQEDGGLLLLE